MGMHEWDHESYLNRCQNFSLRTYKIILSLMSWNPWMQIILLWFSKVLGGGGEDIIKSKIKRAHEGWLFLCLKIKLHRLCYF